MNSVEQVIDNMRDIKPLCDYEFEALNNVCRIIESNTAIPCTGCGYCMPCPFGVNIPSNFKYWNNCFIYDDEKLFKGKYEKISLWACSLGAFFSLLAYQCVKFNQCLFLSPVVDYANV